MPQLKIALLTTADAEDMPVVMRLVEHFPHATIHHAKFHHHKGTANRWAKWWKGGIQRKIANALYPDGKVPTLTELGIRHTVVEPAETEANTTWAEHLKAERPDVLITCGAPMLKRHVFTVPTRGTVNLHWGLVDKFRGADSPFWAMLHKKWDGIGVTLHQMNEAVDGGKVLAQGAPKLHRGDCEAKVWAKLATVAGDLMLAYLHAMSEDGLAPEQEGKPLDKPGPAFRYADRRWYHDVYEFASRFVARPKPTEPWRAYHFSTNSYAPTGKE